MIFATFAKHLYLFGVILCALAIASLATGAQQEALWQAAVMPSELNVYIDASTISRVAMVLKGGYWVDVILEVNSSGIDWCRIQLPSETEAAGYVLCKELERRVFPFEGKYT